MKGPTHNIKSLNKRIEALEEALATLTTQSPRKSMHKVEEFNSVAIPVPEDNLKMNNEDKIISMTNICKILPPNRIKDGRHHRDDVTALAGFIVTDEMLDEVYANYSHEA
jgi:hypothetical protein